MARCPDTGCTSGLSATRYCRPWFKIVEHGRVDSSEVSGAVIVDMCILDWVLTDESKIS
jgi:hypothetical protein